eukprot:12386-Rhodomonas_salina.1
MLLPGATGTGGRSPSLPPRPSTAQPAYASRSAYALATTHTVCTDSSYIGGAPAVATALNAATILTLCILAARASTPGRATASRSSAR